MRKRNFFRALALAGAMFFAAGAARAQTQTNVTATVKDPLGIPYANGRYSIQLVPTGGAATVNGAQIGGTFNGSTDANGSFNVSLWPNASIVTNPQGSSQWQFTVCVSPGVFPPLGTGGQCTPPTAVTISGASQNLSTTLSAVAPTLTTIALGGGSVTNVTGSAPIVSSGGATPAISCPTCNTSSATIAGTISATHLTQATGANTAGDVAGSSVTTATGAIALTAGADTTTPVTINSHSATQSAPLRDINNQSTATSRNGLDLVRGLGTGSSHILRETIQESNTDNAFLIWNKSAPAGNFFYGNMDNSGSFFMGSGPSMGTLSGITFSSLTSGSGSGIDFLYGSGTNGLGIGAIGFSGLATFYGAGSGSAAIGVASAAGSPCEIVLPTVSPTAGQVLSSGAPSSGSCQTSWTASSAFGTPPSAPNGITYLATDSVSGGVGTLGFSWPGVAINAQACGGNAYTVLLADRSGVDTINDASACAVTLPQAGSTNFANNFNFSLLNIGAGLVTITPTTSTINGNATQIVPNHWGSYIYSDNTNYRAGTFPDIAAFPSCADSGGNHLNFTTATGAISCGTSSSGGGGAFSAITSGTNTTAAMICDTGCSLASTAEFDIGKVGTGGVLGVLGSTSGTAKWTAPAVAGTATNALVATNVLSVPVSVVPPSYAFTGHLNDGLGYNTTSNSSEMVTGGGSSAFFFNGKVGVASGGNGGYIWNSSSGSVQAGILQDSTTTTQIDFIDSNFHDFDTLAAQTYSRIPQTGTNTVGNNVTIQAGNGTGNSVPAMVFNDAAEISATSGTAAGTIVHRQAVNDTKVLSTTSATSTNILSLNVAADSEAGTVVKYTVIAKDTTNHVNCVSTGLVTAVAENSAGTIKAAVNAATGVGNANTCTGADTIALSFAITNANPAVLSVTPTWVTIVPTSVYIIYNYDDLSDASITP